MSLQASGNTDPGRLDRRIMLQYPVTSRDASGGETVEWFVGVTVWAAKVWNSSGRNYAAEGKQYESGMTYRIRAREDVAEGWRLVHGDDVFEIVGVEPMGRGHLSELIVRGLDQTPGSPNRTLLLHDGSAFALHGANELLTLHREQDIAA